MNAGTAHAEGHRLVEELSLCPERCRKGVKGGPQPFPFFLPFALEGFFPFQMRPTWRIHARRARLWLFNGGWEGIQPALPAQPIAHVRDKTALFAQPAFRSHETPDGSLDFHQQRKLSASG